jgi:hypothetical protein
MINVGIRLCINESHRARIFILKKQGFAPHSTKWNSNSLLHGGINIIPIW